MGYLGWQPSGICQKGEICIILFVTLKKSYVWYWNVLLSCHEDLNIIRWWIKVWQFWTVLVGKTQKKLHLVFIWIFVIRSVTIWVLEIGFAKISVLSAQNESSSGNKRVTMWVVKMHLSKCTFPGPKTKHLQNLQFLNSRFSHFSRQSCGDKCKGFIT